MKQHHRSVSAALLVVVFGCLMGCANPNSTPRTTEQRRRPATKNLDRTYDWGSRPPPGPMETHIAD